jgi:hypothetical protein
MRCSIIHNHCRVGLAEVAYIPTSEINCPLNSAYVRICRLRASGSSHVIVRTGAQIGEDMVEGL